ncbi:hypothetical protein ABTY20_35030 [Streptomyces sp. NPDC126497]|uniref:hypothetical protein n=1 Tax=Streptomyces sp. NPDC126497 TaxID=3155313 RepID=UPI00331A145A
MADGVPLTTTRTPVPSSRPTAASTATASVLVEDVAESLASSYVEMGDLLRIADRPRQGAQRVGVGDALVGPVGVVEVFELA